MRDPAIALPVVVGLGVGCQWLAARLHVPAILLLLAAGLALGPGFGVLDPDQVFGGMLIPAVSLAVVVVLFEGSLSLTRRELSLAGPVVRRLLSVGVLLTWTITAVLARVVLGPPTDMAILLGAILAVTGPTVIGPMLNQIRPFGVVAPILRSEGVLVDPIGATLGVLVFEVIRRGSSSGWVHAGTGLAVTVVVGALVGGTGALVVGLVVRHHLAPDELEPPVALVVALLVATVANAAFPEAGLLAVTVMGTVLGVQGRVPVRQLAVFKEHLRVLLIGTLFIVLAARLRAHDLAALGWRGIVFVGLLILLVRPLVVVASTWRTDLGWRERLFLTCLAPRGIVAAAVSSVFALELIDAGRRDAGLLVPATFAVIIGTIVVYGVLAPFAARRLGLAEGHRDGLVIVGAHEWARELGAVIERAGFRCVLVDTDRTEVVAARLDGREVVHGSALSEQLLEELDLRGVGRALALTANDELNTLAARQFAETFGRANVYQLCPEADRAGRHEPLPAAWRARSLFGGATFGQLSERVEHGDRFVLTGLTDRFGPDEFLAEHPGAIVLFVVRDGRLKVASGRSAPPLRADVAVIALVGADGADDGDGDDDRRRSSAASPSTAAAAAPGRWRDG